MLRWLGKVLVGLVRVKRKRRRRALVSPFINETNRYIEIQKRIFDEIGFEVRPLSFKSLLMGGIFDVFSSENIVVFHWLETRPFRWAKSGSQVSMVGFLMFFFYYIIMRISLARRVYFIHDHSVHDTKGKVKKISEYIISILARAADIRVVHDPSFKNKYNAHYLPHPIYWNEPQYAHAPAGERKLGVPLSFSIIGALRPYKMIDRVLTIWPKGARLTILGKGPEDYIKKLEDIVDGRSLNESVSIAPSFLTESEFADALDKADVLIMPHAHDSMLVSGLFFESIGRVPVILARSTPFLKWASSIFNNIVEFDDGKSLVEAMAQCENLRHQLDFARTHQRAIEMFGWDQCCSSYRDVFCVWLTGE